jgi:transposase
MAHFHIKKKNGRPYLYVREIARINGKPKVVSQIYIGSPQRTASLVDSTSKKTFKFKVEEFGSLWLAQQMDKQINLVEIVDAVVPKNKNEEGPSVGEYFLYCVWNRMIEAVSKNKIPEWYKQTAIQHIRPIELNKLNSQRYWEKWNRVSEKDINQIARKFFQRVWELESPKADCLLFDTTNYYTFMASHTQSQLARRGKNKEGRHHLRQVGLGLLVARDSRLPLYYCVYPGNLHDSRLFEKVMKEMFDVTCSMNMNNTKQRLTVVIDKGMNSENNYTCIDQHSRIHFITNYSPHFAQHLAATPLERFEPLDINKNRLLEEDEKPWERLLGYRTKGEFWGSQRSVIVTYNPATARKQNYTLNSKLDTVRQELLSMRTKFRNREPHWRDSLAIEERYLRLCERLHLSSEFYLLEFVELEEGVESMVFRKNGYRIEQARAMFGKNIIITDNIDWTTAEIVEASLDRWEVEDRFRLSKNEEMVSTRPIRHWTDSKIRCHLFTCVVALTYLRRLELCLERHGIHRTAEDVMKDMRSFHLVLYLFSGKRNPERCLEEPTKTQAEVLHALGFYVDSNGVLQPLKS